MQQMNTEAARDAYHVLRRDLTEYGMQRAIARGSRIRLSEHEQEQIEQVARLVESTTFGVKAPRRVSKVRFKRAARCARARRKTKPQVKPNYWELVKREFHVFLCTRNKKYAKLRSQLTKASHPTQTAVVATIAAAVAASLGVVAGAIVPLVALCLLALLRVGKEAFCAGQMLI